jgi:hypothetical protein
MPYNCYLDNKAKKILNERREEIRRKLGFTPTDSQIIEHMDNLLKGR